MSERDKESECCFSGEDDELEREKRRVVRKCGEDRIENLREHGAEVGTSEGVVLENKEGGQSEVSPESTPLEIAREADNSKEENSAEVQRKGGCLHTCEDVITVRLAVLPFQYVGAEALVRKSFDRIRKGILRAL